MLIRERAIGDTKSLFAVQLTADGTPINLTGLSVKFEMFNEVGGVVTNETSSGVTISNPTLGYVEYDFQPADVALKGNYYAYFHVYNNAGTERDTFPQGIDELTGHSGILIRLFDPTTNQAPPAEALDITGLAAAPIRTRTVEGTVEERSVNELIKADQYVASKAAAAAGVPWGIKIARTRPGGMVT